MLVMIEKHKEGFALRIKSGYCAGNLITHSILADVLYWPSEEQCKKWVNNTGYELVKTFKTYRQLEIVKGNGRFYVFNFADEHLFTEYNFKKEETAKEIIDWHYEAIK